MEDLIQKLLARINEGLQYDTISGGTANELLLLINEMQALNLHIISNNEVAVCMCEDDWNASDVELTCKHCKKPIEFQQTDC